MTSAVATGERFQSGHLIVSLDGRLSPRKLPRHRLAPVAIRLEGGLSKDDGTPLPRVRKLELGLPGQGVLTTRGLPLCSRRRLRSTTPAEALAVCGRARVGHGSIAAQIALPGQRPFLTRAQLLAFNARMGDRRALLLYGFAANPPAAIVIPFAIEKRSGHRGFALVGLLSPELGPWTRLAHFEIELSRRFGYRGKRRSYLSGSCPAPPRFTAGIALFRSTYWLAGRRKIGISIPRGCRAR
jgi:hypothetical protein